MSYPQIVSFMRCYSCKRGGGGGGCVLTGNLNNYSYKSIYLLIICYFMYNNVSAV